MKYTYRYLSTHPHLFQHPTKPNLFCGAGHDHIGICLFVTPDKLPRESLVAIVNRLTGKKQKWIDSAKAKGH